jgi:hypothetical protein
MTHPVMTLVAVHSLDGSPRSVQFRCSTCGGHPTLDVRTGRIVRDLDCTDHRHDQGYVSVYESSRLSGGPLAHDSISAPSSL